MKNTLEVQRKRIKDILLKRGSITTDYALYKMKPAIKRLSARIFDLRKSGMNIKTITQDDRTAKYLLRNNF